MISWEDKIKRTSHTSIAHVAEKLETIAESLKAIEEASNTRHRESSNSRLKFNDIYNLIDSFVRLESEMNSDTDIQNTRVKMQSILDRIATEISELNDGRLSDIKANLFILNQSLNGKDNEQQSVAIS